MNSYINKFILYRFIMTKILNKKTGKYENITRPEDIAVFSEIHVGRMKI